MVALRDLFFCLFRASFFDFCSSSVFRPLLPAIVKVFNYVMHLRLNPIGEVSACQLDRQALGSAFDRAAALATDLQRDTGGRGREGAFSGLSAFATALATASNAWTDGSSVDTESSTTVDSTPFPRASSAI